MKDLLPAAVVRRRRPTIFTLSSLVLLKGRPRRDDEDFLSRQAVARRSRVSTFVNAVEFSKTGAAAAADAEKKPPTRARGLQVRES